VDHAGAPAAGAWVTLGAKSAVTAADGTFALSRDGAQDALVITALLRGHRPARLAVEPDPATGAPAWPDWIELRLGAPPLSLAGRVVDERGEPRAGVQVWIDDPTPFGTVGDDEMRGQVEFLLAAEARPTGDPGDAYWHNVTTDADGRFELGGLLDRNYRLRLLDAARQETLVTGPQRAGDAGLRVAFPREPLGALRGRVVARDGAPLEGVALRLQCATFGGVWTQGASQRTGAAGRFAFEGVGNAALSLSIRGEGIVPEWRFLHDDARDHEHELLVERLCHLKVELADPGRADGFRALTAGGQALNLHAIDAGGVTYRERMEIVAGRSRAVGVAESAATLVLLLGDEEVARVPLSLAVDELNTVLL
jgi:hypothetical protein